MKNARFEYPKAFYQFYKFFPFVAFALTTPVKLFEKQSFHLAHKADADLTKSFDPRKTQKARKYQGHLLSLNMSRLRPTVPHLPPNSTGAPATFAACSRR